MKMTQGEKMIWAAVFACSWQRRQPAHLCLEDASIAVRACRTLSSDSSIAPSLPLLKCEEQEEQMLQEMIARDPG